MGEADQIIAWAKGAFDGIEREHRPDHNGSHFVVVGVTRASLLAYNRQLGGRIAHIEAEMARIRESSEAFAWTVGTDPAPAMREIERLALAEGDTDFAWVAAFLNGRDDLATGARFLDAELAALPAAENVRHGLRALAERGILEVRIEREGWPSMTWHVFVPE